MSAVTPERLVYMANQIADFFKTQPGDAAGLHVAEHIKAFWTPSMRAMLLEYVDAGHGGGLQPVAAEGVELMRRRSSKVLERALAMKGENAPGHQPGDDAG